MDDKQVAKTIQDQIGAKALFLIGAKQFAIPTGGGLRFRVGRNGLNVNLVEIKLNRGTDLYDIAFWRIQGASGKVKKQVDGVYAEDLRTTIGSTLGLVTSFPTFGKQVEGERGTDQPHGICAEMGEFGATTEAEAYAMRDPILAKYAKEKPSEPGPITVAIYLPKSGGDPEVLVAALKADKELGGAVTKTEWGEVRVSVMSPTYSDAEKTVVDAMKRIGWQQDRNDANEPMHTQYPAVYSESGEELYRGPLLECQKFQYHCNEQTAVSVPVTSVAAMRQAKARAQKMGTDSNSTIHRLGKSAKEAVNYSDSGGTDDLRCGNCAWAKLPATCRKVEGKISQDGSCRLWKRGIMSEDEPFRPE